MVATSIRRLRGKAREVHARAVLRRWAAGGSSKSAFCRKEGICTVTLSRWLREFGAVSRPAADGAFVEVRLDREPTRSGFEIEFPSGRRLRVHPGFDAVELERLLGLVDRAPC